MEVAVRQQALDCNPSRAGDIAQHPRPQCHQCDADVLRKAERLPGLDTRQRLDDLHQAHRCHLLHVAGSGGWATVLAGEISGLDHEVEMTRPAQLADVGSLLPHPASKPGERDVTERR